MASTISRKIQAGASLIVFYDDARLTDVIASINFGEKEPQVHYVDSPESLSGLRQAIAASR